MKSAWGTPAKIDFCLQPLAPFLQGGVGWRDEEGERQREGEREREKEGGKERDFPFPWADGIMEEEKDNTDCRLESTFLPIHSSVY